MKIEVWSDIVCPWCYIGKRRLEAALDGFDEEVEIQWRSFELDPGAPRQPKLPLDKALAKKYGTSLDRARQMMAQMTNTAKKEGLNFDFSIARGGNTFDAHRLLHYAETKDMQDPMKERLLRAYMTEGRPISERDELATLAADVGLDADAVRAMLETDKFGDAVRKDEARATDIGVRGVPFFLIDESSALSGAQPAETIRAELQRVERQRHGPPSSAGPGCDDDSCEVR